jgi:hypothetical protein
MQRIRVKRFYTRQLNVKSDALGVRFTVYIRFTTISLLLNSHRILNVQLFFDARVGIWGNDMLICGEKI